VALAKTLFPCIAEIIQSHNEFPFQECQLPDISGPLQQSGGTCPLKEGKLPEGASKHLSWMESSQMIPQIFRNKIQKDHWNYN
jgi:hypothetical protein